jgi:DNA-nicking Smr family endonuclease
VDPDEPFELEITDVLDLHTVPPRDVREVVEAYLDEARVRGFRFVRIIHGRGIGVQRETVRAGARAHALHSAVRRCAVGSRRLGRNDRYAVI